MATPTFWVPYIHINDINNMLLDIGGTPDAEQIPGQPHCFDIPCVLPNNQYAAMSVRVDESSKQSVINVIAAKSFLEFDIAFSSSVVAIGGKCSRRMKVNAILLGESSSVCRFILIEFSADLMICGSCRYGRCTRNKISLKGCHHIFALVVGHAYW